MNRPFLLGIMLASGACADFSEANIYSLQLGARTPPNACKDIDDCSFSDKKISYVSFEGRITKREFCQSPLPFGIKQSDKIGLVAQKLAAQFKTKPRLSPAGGGAPKAISVSHRVGRDDVTISAEFKKNGRLSCVSEMISSF